jgi:hypothetical protein
LPLLSMRLRLLEVNGPDLPPLLLLRLLPRCRNSRRNKPPHLLV